MHKEEMRLSDLIAATTLTFLQSILQMSSEECVANVNLWDKNDLIASLETHGGNPRFIFSLGVIYLKAKATRSFPMRLAELLFHHVCQTSQGTQEFLQFLNDSFEENKNSYPRFLWGLCESCSSNDLESFLKPRNSSPLLVFYWLQIAIQKQKPIVKEFFQILERIKKNPPIFENVIQLMVRNKTHLLFDPAIGCLENMTGVVFNLLHLFEINWNLTSAELELLRNFLREHPISANFLVDPQYISAECSRYLIGEVMNFAGLLHTSGRLALSVLLLPDNLTRIAEFVYLSDNELATIFRINHDVFNQILTPGKYSFYKVLLFFNNLTYSNQELFSRIRDALKEYGNKLTPQDLKLIPNVLKSMPDDLRDAAHFFLAFMCIARKEKIKCLDDHIMLLNGLLDRGSQQFIEVVPSSPANFPTIVRKLRACFSNFVLNLMCLEIKTPQVNEPLLPVLQTDTQDSVSVYEFLESNAQSGSFTCLLQLLMLSRTIELLWANMERVMNHIKQHQAVDFMMMQSELFHILDELFNNRFNVGLLHFNDHIHGLLPKHPKGNSIFDAFVDDKRFHHLVRGVHDERKVAEYKKKCEDLTTIRPGSTPDDAQRELDVFVFECPVCKSFVTNGFLTAIGCGHTFCTSCVQKINECSMCRKKIETSFECGELKMRYKRKPDELSSQPLKKSNSSE
jgi:hypothetical protein